MTDRFHSLQVVLEQNIRDDDCERLIDAIKMVRGVLSVKGDIATPDTYMAEQRAIDGLGQSIVDLIYESRN